jgi:6-phosphogluconolactonase
MKNLEFETCEWPDKCAELIHRDIIFFLERDGYCSVILTGGRSAKKVYDKLSDYLPQYKGVIEFYLGDERCVSETDSESNYGMVLNSLFHNHEVNSNSVHKFYDSSSSIHDNLLRYENQLPTYPNIILLGLGDDGHIASLFPNQDYVGKKCKVIQVMSPNGQKRLTITPEYINSAERIFIFALGLIKKNIVSKILSLETKSTDIPCSLVNHGTWLTIK